MPSPPPTFARVASVKHWDTLFHPKTGLLRLPNIEGKTIEHLDIDLRFINHEFDDDPKDHYHSLTPNAIAEVYLPGVSVLTLRGAEHVCDHDERMDALADVLLAIRPTEVRWLNANNDPAEQLTFSTHLVHPAVIAAGEMWSRQGGVKRVVIQGGFPCPNLSAPTPFSLTPAATPCHSPGPGKTSFGTTIHSLTTLPSLSLTKPKPVDEKKAKEQAERKRLAEYSLKPRFDWAMGSWGAEDVEWRFDGRYTPACILSSIEHFLNALNKSFPHASAKVDSALPSCITIAPLPVQVVPSIRYLVHKLNLDEELIAYLADTVFFATSDATRHARLFESTTPESDERQRQNRRIKGDMMFLQANTKTTIVTLAAIAGDMLDPMSKSIGSIVPDDTNFSTDDESEAVTPEMGASVFMPPQTGVKGDRALPAASSLVL